MKAWAFGMAFNEAALIRYWVRHYRSFCERVIVYVDQGTTDRTAEIAWAEGAEVRNYFGPDVFDDLALIHHANTCYKGARGLADWVIWTDIDEILYHPRLAERLTKLLEVGVNFPSTVGYTMFGDHPPRGRRPIYRQISKGVRSPAYDKVAVFSPYLDIEWDVGKHKAKINGHVVARADDGTDPFKLLHYRWLGEAWFDARNARNFSRLSENNKLNKLGIEVDPSYDGMYSKAWHLAQQEQAVDCVRWSS